MSIRTTWRRLLRRSRPSLGALALGALTVALLGSAPAAAVSLVTDIDPAQSQIEGLGALSGRITLELAELPPLAANTTFDVVALSAAAGAFQFSLDADLASPGLGVLRPDGAFLIPSLFLTVDDGAGSFDVTLLDVTGTFATGGPCGLAPCLAFAFEAPGVQGPLEVTVVASVPEPFLPAAGLGLLGSCFARGLRRRRGDLR